MKSKILTTALICLLISFAAGTSAFAQDSAAVGQYYETQVENIAGDIPESLTIEETAKNLPEDTTEVGEAAEKPAEEKTDVEEPEADRKQAEASNEYSSAENQQKETSGGSEEEIAYEQEGNNTQHADTPDVQDDTSNADDPFLEGDYQETAGHTDQAGNESPSGNSNVEILKYSYERVTTNEKYCSLSFQFTNKADNKVYEAYITGINIVPVDGKTLDEVIVPLLTDMAKSFCSQTEFWLYNNDTDDFIKKYNLHVASIDAEKQDQTRATGTNSDSLLCWAASASNMLEFTGWGSVVDTETEEPGVTEQKFADEDDILQYFEESFTDVGLTARAGVEWFFNGINDSQKVVNGKVQYTDDITVDPSQQKSNEAAHCGNLIQYAADEVVSSFWFKQSGFLPSLYDAAVGLKNGSGVGLSITWYDKTTGKFKSGHAITMFGYIKDTSVDGPESLVGIFTTDSEDNKYQDKNRKNIVNRIRMNCLSDFSFTEKSEVFESKVMVGYSRSEQSVTVIKRFAILEAYQKDMPEDKGTKNAITTPDYTVRWINITDEDKKTVNSVDVGDLVNLLVITQNSSYANIDLTTYPSAYISGEFVIYKNDKVFDSVSFSNYLSNAGRYPLGKYSIRTVYSFAEKGNYQVSANISGIYYTGKEGSTVQLVEAYADMYAEAIDAYSELSEEGKLKLRTYAFAPNAKMLPQGADAAVEQIEEWVKKYDGEYFKFRGFKLFMDGVVDAGTADLIEEYADMPGHFGVSQLAGKEQLIKDIVKKLNAKGIPIHVHAIGDAAVRKIVDILEESQFECCNFNLRNMVAHLELVKPDDIERMAKYKIIPVVAPLWVNKAPVFFEHEIRKLGVDRAYGAFPVKSFEDAGATICFHTDYPVTSRVDIPVEIYQAVKREAPGHGPKSVRNADEGISVMRAILALTVNAAFAVGQENNLGTLQIGKIANAVVYDRDFLKCDVEEIPDSKLVATIIDGTEVYKA